MKKLQLLFILWIFAFPLMAQNVVTVSGTVTDITTGAPIPNHEVIIQADSAYGLYYYDVVSTNPNGFYSDNIPISPSSSFGAINISTMDCQNYYQTVTLTYSLPNLNLVHNFQICYNSAPECDANFIHQNAGPLTVQFTDQSVGGYGVRSWNFGDNTSSTLLNPVHTYSAPGNYYVTLAIGAQGTTCWDHEIQAIFVGDSLPVGCQAYFYANPDPLIPLQINFTNYSSGNLSTFAWSFGDGAGTTISYPGNPNVSHIYTQPGPYNVCLTVQGADSLCTSTYCMQVIVQGNNTGCQANFSYSQDSGQFIDLSQHQGPVTWLWNFGDPASGVNNISNLQNPTHIYSFPMVYTACLTIMSPDSSCFDTECHQIYIGDTIPSGCQAYYTFAPVPGATPNVIQFTDASMSSGAVSWFWNFDDGTTSTEQNPVHVFPAGPVIDPYFVCLTISKSDSTCFDTFCMPIIPQNEGCHAEFSFDHDPGSPPNALHFVDHSQSQGPVSWYWSFGDSTFSTEQNPIHEFAQPGSYNVCLTISSSNIMCYNTECHEVNIGEQQGCEARFSFDHDPGSPPTALHFIDLSESQGPVSWYWNFGDGTYSNEQNPIHEFPQTGFYQVCLTISGNDSLCYDTECHQVNVGGQQGCQAQFSFYPDSIAGSHTINFVDLSYGTVTNWAWDFGDPASGANNFSSVQNPSHAYYQQGNYHVCLTISDRENGEVLCQSTWCQEIETGQPSNCANYFSHQNAGHAVSFTGNVLNGLAATYVWDFGDNQLGTGQTLIHNYAANGIYFVTLTTADSLGCTATSSQNVVVGDSALWNQVYGQVFAGDFPSQGGLVMIFSVDTTNSYMPFFDLAFVNPQGVYYFPMVPQGNFVVYAIPFTLDYAPTYYGDVLNWQSATVITLGQANNPYDIHLLQSDAFIQGTGSITGQIIEGDISASMVDKVTMLLKDASGKTISYNQVNGAGSFAFPQLAYGTYYLYAELAGCNTENIRVEISANTPSADVSMTLSGHSILGVSNTLPSIESVVIYPVPAKDVANVTITLPENNEMTIELFNMSGRMVYRNVTSVIAGESTITIPLTNFANGIYQLSIIMQDGTRINKKLVKTN
jgi:PKD repeat protein